MSKPFISIILPAHDEAEYIGDCLAALLASDEASCTAEVIVVANACTDATVPVAQSYTERAQAKGWGYQVIETSDSGKLNALNLGDTIAQGTQRAYLDADVIVSPALIGQIVNALDVSDPCYASGSPLVSPANSSVTRGFARIWQQLPFVTSGVPGFGLFAVNAKGRARWDAFPPGIISDDTFVRLQFAPSERIRVAATYHWPMVEGLRNLVRVRRRQDEGVAEIANTFPELLKNDEIPSPSKRQLAGMALRDPIGFATYALVKFLVKTPYARSTHHWARGR